MRNALFSIKLDIPHSLNHNILFISRTTLSGKEKIWPRITCFFCPNLHEFLPYIYFTHVSLYHCKSVCIKSNSFSTVHLIRNKFCACVLSRFGRFGRGRFCNPSGKRTTVMYKNEFASLGSILFCLRVVPFFRRRL